MSDPVDRLDSWKAIAEYLQRDERTLRRWEKQGLPVRRVAGGSGHSVFAFKTEIDAWLRSRAGQPDQPQASPHLSPTSHAPARISVPWRAVVAAVGVAAVALSWTMLAPVATGQVARAVITQTHVAAVDDRGDEVWRHTFSPDVLTLLSESVAEPTIVARSAPEGVYALTSYVVGRRDSMPGPGSLWFFAPDGTPQRTFTFDDRWTFGDGRTYGGPWAMTDFRVDDRYGRRVVVAAHHMEWWPSVVTMLDERGQRQGTFVNSGWIESLRWIDGDRLAVAGFNNALNGGMLAILEAGNIDGHSPEPAGSPYACVGCPTGAPLMYLVFPRSELNRVTGSGFNRALVNVDSSGLTVRTSELDRPDNIGPLTDILYTFSTDLALIEARFSDRYWDRHRQLELDGRIPHGRAECPDRDGPPPVRVWTADLGWRDLVAAR